MSAFLTRLATTGILLLLAGFLPATLLLAWLVAALILLTWVLVILVLVRHL